MNKNLLLGIGAVVIIAAAGVFFFMNGGAQGIATLGNTSLRELLSANVSQKCTFDNAESSGTIYVGAGKMRADFTSKSGEAAAVSHMVISNNIAYVWLDGVPQGYRMNFENLSGQGGAQVGGVDADAKVATKCEGWQATEDTFSLPTDVTFSEVGAAPQAATQNSTSASTNTSTDASAAAKTNMSYYEQQCAACNMITDAGAKAQCIASFDCPAN